MSHASTAPSPVAGLGSAAHDDVLIPRHALEQLRQGMCVYDSARRLVLFNRRYAEIYGLEPESLTPGMTLHDVIDLRYAVGAVPTMTAAEYEAWRDRIWVDNREVESVVHLRNGRIVEIYHKPTADGGWVATHEDVTARRVAEEGLRQKTAMLDATLENMDQGLMMIDAQGVVRLCNERATHMLGLLPEMMRARPTIDAVRRFQLERGDFARSDASLRDAIAEEGPDLIVGSYERERPNGTILEVRVAALPEGGYVRTYTDVTLRRQAEARVSASEERLALALDAGSDGLWDHDMATGNVWYSDRWQTMLGYEPGELAHHRSTWERLIHPEDRPRAAHALTEHVAGRAPVYECEFRLLRKDGGWGWILARGKIVARAADGTPLRLVGTHIDIDARKAAEGRIAHLARHDALTDLPNRVLFRERLEQRLAEAARYARPCAVLCLDLDRFKAVNDTLGHLAGDALLREVARRLRATLRTTDTVARIGGDEFAILVDGAEEAASVFRVADKLIAAVGSPVAFAEQMVEVGLSVGIAFAPEHGQDAETLVKRADLALYRAKAEGRNVARAFEPAMDEAEAARRGLERDLRLALSRNELTLHYQPQVQSGTREIVGFEALVRWMHPTHGLVPPGTFIPLAEESGLIVPLGEWVMRTACREATRWRVPLKIAVNLSPRQFAQADLPDTVLAILRETGLSPARLELEVTETVIINDMVRALSILRRLKGLGISIAMDDFGTGYSSLATLQAFPFDKIKIDRAFVGKVGNSPQAAVIVRTVLGLGRSLGMGVVAEGVETVEQMRFLEAERCEEVQGYLTGRPAPIEAFAASVSGQGERSPGRARRASKRRA